MSIRVDEKKKGFETDAEYLTQGSVLWQKKKKRERKKRERKKKRKKNVKLPVFAFLLVSLKMVETSDLRINNVSKTNTFSCRSPAAFCRERYLKSWHRPHACLVHLTCGFRHFRSRGLWRVMKRTSLGRPPPPFPVSSPSTFSLFSQMPRSLLSLLSFSLSLSSLSGFQTR